MTEDIEDPVITWLVTYDTSSDPTVNDSDMEFTDYDRACQVASRYNLNLWECIEGEARYLVWEARKINKEA